MTDRVIIFTGLLLPASETFIRSQGEALQQFTPWYVGCRFVPGLTLPSDRTYAINQGGVLGRLTETSFKLTGYAPALYSKLLQLQPALIHAHFGVNGTLALPVAKRFNLPLITTFHGLDASLTRTSTESASLTQRLYFRRQASLKRDAQRFLAVSDFIHQKLLNQGFPADKVVTHYTGVDTHFFQPDPATAREPIVLFVGRLTEKKGCEYLIRAMADVQVTHPNVQLVILGDGSLRAALEASAAQQLRNYRFLGMQPPEICQQWMQRSHLIVIPSVTTLTGDSEGLPTVLLEAQASGLPVIASMHAGIPEIIRHEKTGFLTAERDWQQIAGYIIQLLTNSELWQCFSQQGQKRVQLYFDLQKQAKSLEKLYWESFMSSDSTKDQ